MLERQKNLRRSAVVVIAHAVQAQQDRKVSAEAF